MQPPLSHGMAVDVHSPAQEPGSRFGVQGSGLVEPRTPLAPRERRRRIRNPKSEVRNRNQKCARLPTVASLAAKAGYPKPPLLSVCSGIAAPKPPTLLRWRPRSAIAAYHARLKRDGVGTVTLSA